MHVSSFHFDVLDIAHLLNSAGNIEINIKYVSGRLLYTTNTDCNEGSNALVHH